MTLSMQAREANMTKCINCGVRCLSIIIVEGYPFCNSICYTEWKWKQEEYESQNRRVKKVSELPEKGFHSDGNRIGSTPGSVDKKEAGC